MDIRCIVLDMDMTTLGTDKKISDANRDALKYVISKGIHVAIASGRPFSSLPQDVVSIPGVEYAITSNGAAIYHIPSGSRMAHYTLEPETVEKVVAALKEQPYACEAFVDGKGYSPAEFIADPTQFGAPVYAGKYLRRTRTPVSDIHAFILEHKHQLDSISVITDSLSISNHLYPLLRKELPNCYLTCSADHMVEIAHQDCSKHTAVRFLAEHLQLTPDQSPPLATATTMRRCLRMWDRALPLPMLPPPVLPPPTMFHSTFPKVPLPTVFIKSCSFKSFRRRQIAASVFCHTSLEHDNASSVKYSTEISLKILRICCINH